MDTTGKRIRAVREGLGLTQAELAKKVGGRAAKISKYEMNQREPEIATLIKIAQLGNKDLNWLLTGNSSGAQNEIDKSLGKLIAQVERIYKEGNSKKLSAIKYLLDISDPRKIKKKEQ